MLEWYEPDRVYRAVCHGFNLEIRFRRSTGGMTDNMGVSQIITGGAEGGLQSVIVSMPTMLAASPALPWGYDVLDGDITLPESMTPQDVVNAINAGAIALMSGEDRMDVQVDGSTLYLHSKTLQANIYRLEIDSESVRQLHLVRVSDASSLSAAYWN